MVLTPRALRQLEILPNCSRIRLMNVSESDGATLQIKTVTGVSHSIVHYVLCFDKICYFD